MVSEAFVAFLMALATDPVKAEALRADPNAVLAAVALSDDEKALLRGGDGLKIQQAIAGPNETWGCPAEEKFVRPW